MSCVLRVFGESFDPTSFLQAVELDPYETARKGDPHVPEDNWENLRAQIQDAIAFLKRHYPDLERLKSEIAVEGKWLDFGYNCRLNPKSVVMQGEYIPLELIKLAAELEIEIGLSLYPPDFTDWIEQYAARAEPDFGTSG